MKPFQRIQQRANRRFWKSHRRIANGKLSTATIMAGTTSAMIHSTVQNIKSQSIPDDDPKALANKKFAVANATIKGTAVVTKFSAEISEAVVQIKRADRQLRKVA